MRIFSLVIQKMFSPFRVRGGQGNPESETAVSGAGHYHHAVALGCPVLHMILMLPPHGPYVPYGQHVCDRGPEKVP